MIARSATWLLIALVGLAPMWLGSNRPLPWSFNAVIAGLIALLTALVIVTEHRRYHLRFDLVLAPLLLWGLALGWAGIQITPLGVGAGPEHPIWLVTQSFGVQDLSPSISVNRHETLESMLRLLTYGCVFLAAFVLGRNADRARLLLRTIVVAAVVFALYGLLRQATAASKILWFDEVSPHVLTSTFINRNSAATYFGIAAVVALAFLQRSIRHLVHNADREVTARGGLERMISGMVGVPGLEAAAFILLLSATLLTQSRAGSIAVLLAVSSLLVFHTLGRLRAGGGFGVSVAVVLVMFVSFGVIEISGANVLSRIVSSDVAPGERLAVVSDTMSAIADNALYGTGLGTFQDIFPIYRVETNPSDTIWDKAHNDYLEALLGLGVPAGTALILAIASAVALAMRGMFVRRRNSHFCKAGAAAGVLCGLHALFDFSLQIQAVALMLAMILGVAVAQSVTDRSS